jgi:hypothetical protein
MIPLLKTQKIIVWRIYREIN